MSRAPSEFTLEPLPTVPGSPVPRCRGRRFGCYELLAELDHGGMGTVWLARVSEGARRRRLVVIKSVRDEWLDRPAVLRMFEQEARLSIRLQHPNIVRTLEIGEAGGLPYLVLEHVDGHSLRSILAQCGSLHMAVPLTHLLRIGLDACKALHAVHGSTDEAGRPLRIVHRDITARNLVVSFAGRTKLIDFGIAKFHGAPVQTKVGVVKGTMAYMAPEQAAGRRVDRRADVYALGVVLYELTTGRLPYRRQPRSLRGHVEAAEHPLPAVHHRPLPPSLNALLLRALHPDPEQRIPSARHLHVELQRVGITACGPEDLGRWLRRLFATRARQAAYPSCES